MRFSPERIKKLQSLLKEHRGLDYTAEEAQEAGLAIIRIISAKKLDLNNPTRAMENDNEINVPRNNTRRAN